MSRIGCGCGRIGTELAGPGHCIARPSQGITNMFVGPVERSELSAAACKYIVDAFAKGGLSPEYTTTSAPTSGRRPPPTAASIPSAPCWV